MTQVQDKEFQQRIGRIEGLVHQIEQLPDPNAQATAQELMRLLLELHGAGLERMLDLIFETSASGQELIDVLAQDDLVSNLLLLHGLHPLPLETRVQQALDQVRPYMQSHGGNVELLGVTDQGAVQLRLEGSCHGCPSSRVTLRYAVEEAIYATAPDVTAIETEGAVDLPSSSAPNFIPMSQLLDTAPAPRSNGAGWVKVEGLASLHEGMLRVVDVENLPVLFCRVSENLYAYANSCPNCGQLLGQGKLAGKELVCAACGHHYDVMRAGRDLDAHNLHLEPFPLLEQDGEVKIALPVLQGFSKVASVVIASAAKQSQS